MVQLNYIEQLYTLFGTDWIHCISSTEVEKKDKKKNSYQSLLKDKASLGTKLMTIKHVPSEGSTLPLPQT